jgi:hypothetical protein
MAITEKNTILVLGAGATAPFGFPLGSTLISDIAEQLQREIKSIQDANDYGGNQLRQKLMYAARSPDGFSRFPIHGATAQRHISKDRRDLDAEAMNQDLARIRSLADLLNNQTSETIDDFIVENPSFSDLTKIAIAADFISRSYSLEDGALRLKNFEARYWTTANGDRKRNWVHLLINIVRHGIRSGNVTKENKVQIITFNYDTVLELVLSKQFRNTESNYSSYTDYISIQHVHGECGTLEDICKHPAKTCLDWASNINVVNEQSVPDKVKMSREFARELTQLASELYFCGFSFSGPNCRLLGLDSPRNFTRERTISYCNYDGNVGIQKTVEKFKQHDLSSQVKIDGAPITHIEEASGTIGAPLEICDWFRLGYLGELPG